MRNCAECDQFRIIYVCNKVHAETTSQYNVCSDFEHEGSKPFKERPDLKEMNVPSAEHFRTCLNWDTEED